MREVKFLIATVEEGYVGVNLHLDTLKWFHEHMNYTLTKNRLRLYPYLNADILDNEIIVKTHSLDKLPLIKENKLQITKPHMFIIGKKVKDDIKYLVMELQQHKSELLEITEEQILKSDTILINAQRLLNNQGIRYLNGNVDTFMDIANYETKGKYTSKDYEVAFENVFKKMSTKDVRITLSNPREVEDLVGYPLSYIVERTYHLGVNDIACKFKDYSRIKDYVYFTNTKDEYTQKEIDSIGVLKEDKSVIVIDTLQQAKHELLVKGKRLRDNRPNTYIELVEGENGVDVIVMEHFTHILNFKELGLDGFGQETNPEEVVKHLTWEYIENRKTEIEVVTHLTEEEKTFSNNEIMKLRGDNPKYIVVKLKGGVE